MRLKSAFRQAVTFLSASALIVSGFVYMDAVSTPAEANVPGDSVALKTKNTVDYFANLEASTASMKSDNATGPIPATGNFTIEAWVFDPSSRTNFSSILGQRSTSDTGTNRFQILVDPNDTQSVDYLDQELLILYRNEAIRTLYKLPQNRWVHIAFSQEGTTLKLFLDGNQVFSTTSSATNPIQGPLLVGREPSDSSTNFWTGSIDQIKIWNGALTAVNVVESMHSWGSAGVTSAPSLEAHYDFNDRTAANGIVLNKAANRHHLNVTGSIEFEDVKVTNQFNSKTIYSFPRTYLTEVGGWVVPTGVTAIPEALVVGAGGGGGGDGGNGGGGGAGQIGSVPTVTSGQILGVRVGQGGSQYQNGQASALTSGASDIARAAGGFGGGGWQEPGISSGGVATVFANFTGYNGGAGGEGPAGTALNQPAVSGGQPGNTATSILNGGLAAPIRFGGGGGGGISAVNSGVIPSISAAAGGNGGGGEGASTGAIGTGKYFCGTATTGTGISTGGDGAPNSGGGGGAGSANGGTTSGGDAFCRTDPNTGYDGERTFGGHGGSGVVVLSVQMEARCAYLNDGATLAQNPKVQIAPLSGFSGGTHQITPTATTLSAYSGNTVLAGGWLYFVDVGRSEVRRMKPDGTRVQILGSVTGIFGSLATDGNFIYGQSKTHIFRLDPRTQALDSTFRTKNLGAHGVVGGIAYGYSNSVGHLYFTHSADAANTLNELIYRVPVSESGSVSIFARNRLASTEAVTTARLVSLTVQGSQLFWASAQQNSARVLSKSLSGSAGEYAEDVVLANQSNINTIASFGNRLYWNFSLTTQLLQSAEVGQWSERTEFSGLLFPRVGINVQSVCNSPTNFPLQLTSSTTDLTASWSSMLGAGTKPQILQYRIDNGAWTEVLADSTSTTGSITKPNSNGSIVEFRVTSFEYGQWQEWVHSDAIVIQSYSTPAPCANPMKLKYVVPAGGKIDLSLATSYTPVTIRWGDGTEITGVSFVQGYAANKTYSQAGTYVVEICGVFREFSGSSNPKPYLTEVMQWGEWITIGAGQGTFRSLSQAFWNANNLVSVPGNLPSTVNSLFRTFQGASKLNDPNLLTWDVSNVTTMQSTFSGATSFNQPIGNWNVSKVVYFNGMFGGASNFDQDLSNWQTAAAVSMAAMFSGAKKYNNGGVPMPKDGNKWNTQKAVFLSSMFAQTDSFNQDLSSWDVSAAADMSFMFWRAKAFNGNIIPWNVSNVTNMGGMFQEAPAFNRDISGWNTVKVSNMSNMFASATAYKFKVPNKLNALTNAAGMLNFSGISNETYGQILVEWDAATKLNGGTLGAVGKTAACSPQFSAYSNQTPRGAVLNMTSTAAGKAGWTIVDSTNRDPNFCTKSVTVTANNTTQVYGDPVPSVGFTVSSDFTGANWLNDISCRAEVSSNSAAVTSSTAAGTTSRTVCTGPSGSGIGLAISYVNGTHTITKRPIAIQVQNKIKIATDSLSLPITTNSDASPNNDYVITSGNLVNGDVISIDVDKRTSGDNINAAGTYNLKGTLAGTSPSSNYSAVITDGVLTVSPKSLVVTGKNVTKTYGDSITLSSSDGWVCVGSNCADTLAGKVSLTSTGLGSFAAAGTYPITSTVTGLNPSQYDVVNDDGGTVTVVKKTLIVTPTNQTVQAGTTLGPLTYSITGFVNGQGVGVIDQLPTCTSGYTTNTTRGTTLAITCGGASDNNYDFVYQAGTLTVPALSNVSDLTPSQVVPDTETGLAIVPFQFVVTPFLQVCFANLTVNTLTADGEVIFGEPIRVEVTSSILEIELELYEGQYEYTLDVDGNCSVDPEIKPLLIAPFAAVGGAEFKVIQPTKLTPSKALPNKRTPAVISGIGLQDVIELRIGKFRIKALVASDSKITFDIPRLRSGRYDILLVFKDGSTLRWESPLRITGKAKATKVNRSFASFAAGSFVMPASMKQSIRQYLVANKSKFRTVECVGYTDGPFVRRLDVPLAMNRARVVCEFAKRLGYKIESRSYVNKSAPGAQNRKVKLILGK